MADTDQLYTHDVSCLSVTPLGQGKGYARIPGLLADQTALKYIFIFFYKIFAGGP